MTACVVNACLSSQITAHTESRPKALLGSVTWGWRLSFLTANPTFLPKNSYNLPDLFYFNMLLVKNCNSWEYVTPVNHVETEKFENLKLGL